MTEPKTHLIWSHEHQAWWRADSRGYTGRLLEAGLYTKAEAEDVASTFHGEGRRHESALEAKPVFEAFAAAAEVREEEARMDRFRFRNLSRMPSAAPTTEATP